MISASMPVTSLRPSGGVRPICSKPEMAMFGAPRMGFPLMVASGLRNKPKALVSKLLVVAGRELISDGHRMGDVLVVGFPSNVWDSGLGVIPLAVSRASALFCQANDGSVANPDRPMT